MNVQIIPGVRPSRAITSPPQGTTIDIPQSLFPLPDSLPSPLTSVTSGAHVNPLGFEEEVEAEHDPRVDLSDRDAVSKMSIRDILTNTKGGQTSSRQSRKKQTRKGKKRPRENEQEIPEEEYDDAEDARLAESMAPQVTVVDGRVVVGTQTVTVPESNKRRRLLRSNPTVVDDDEHLGGIRRGPTDKWTVKETKLFYLALRQCGCDFTLIQKFFPTRSRRQIKGKFNKEERVHPALVDYALKNPMPLNLDHFRREGVDLPRPTQEDLDADHSHIVMELARRRALEGDLDDEDLRRSGGRDLIIEDDEDAFEVDGGREDYGDE